MEAEVLEARKLTARLLQLEAERKTYVQRIDWLQESLDTANKAREELLQWKLKWNADHSESLQLIRKHEVERIARALESEFQMPNIAKIVRTLAPLE